MQYSFKIIDVEGNSINENNEFNKLLMLDDKDK